MLRIYSQSLGCPKTRVDTERLLGSLGPVVTVDLPEKADLVFLNTCAFIAPAVQESVQTIVEMIEDLSAMPAAKKPFFAVAGCLPGRYGIADLKAELRFYDGQGREVPFRVRKAVTEPERRNTFDEVPSRIIALDQQGNTGIFTVENPSGAAIGMLRVDTADRDFDKTLTVEAGDDGKNWRRVAGPQPFYDYSSRGPLRNVRIGFPAVKARYFRVLIGSYVENEPLPSSRVITGSGEPRTERIWMERRLKVDAVALLKPVEETVHAGKEELFAYALEPQGKRREENGWTVLTFRSSREPLAELEIRSSTPDYVREAVVFGSTDGRKFVRLAAAPLFRLRFDPAQPDSAPVKLAETRYPFYRVDSRNDDNRPLEDITVQARGPGYFAEFLTRDRPAGLRYGGDVPVPKYDLPAVLDRMKNPAVQEWKAGPGKANPEFRAGRINLYRWLPGAALVILGAVLCWALWRGIKTIEQP